jgi:hypothetical protein
MLPNIQSMMFGFSSGDLELMQWDEEAPLISEEDSMTKKLYRVVV